MEKNESEIFMTMSPFEFDQSPQGWRSLANEGRKLEAAQLIKEYIGRNMERIINGWQIRNQLFSLINVTIPKLSIVLL